jgi:hypothetical protein
MSSASRFFSVDSTKAIKANAYGYLNAINYMAPANTAGAGNLCPHASPGCLALCLGWYSGQSAMISNAELETGTNATRASRARKSVQFMHDRKAFFVEMIRGIESAIRQAKRLGLKLCVRPNGATDIVWESVAPLMFATYSDIQFVDYTKNYKRMLRFCEGKLPSNYHLTFSRSETNESQCLDVARAGGNVAVVFAEEVKAQALTQGYLGLPVVDGDLHDLRHLDPKGGFVIALSPKGRKTKSDMSGFVVRSL